MTFEADSPDAPALPNRRDVKLYHHCRNKKCRSKLPQPVEMERAAFCTKHCFVQHHASGHCLVCGKDCGKKNINGRKPELNFCGRNCKNAYRRQPEAYQYLSKAKAPGGIPREAPASKQVETAPNKRVKSRRSRGGESFLPIFGFPAGIRLPMRAKGIDPETRLNIIALELFRSWPREDEEPIRVEAKPRITRVLPGKPKIERVLPAKRAPVSLIARPPDDADNLEIPAFLRRTE